MTLGNRTTAKEALQGRSLKGFKAIVTGANSGIGAETARVLALAGADVTMAVRSIEGGEKVKAELEKSLPAGSGSLRVAQLDLADLKSVRAFAAGGGDAPIDLLVNNAGIMATPLGATAQGFEQQMGTNHLGHFLLTELLLPRLRKSKAARIVNVSSDLHRNGVGASVLATLDSDPKFAQRKYKPFGAYGDSKLANVLFTRALAKRLPPNVSAFSLHPGVIGTNLSRHMGFQGVLFRAVGGLFMKTISQGAATSVYAASAPELDGKSGAYLADCHEAAPKPEALDDKLADKVWELSERLVHEPG